MINADDKWFPCPVCLRPLDVRTSKRKKPYVICSPCGVQMFIRERAGIEAFEALVEQGRKDNVLARVAELERRCRLQCPQCGKSFWLSPELIITNTFRKYCAHAGQARQQLSPDKSLKRPSISISPRSSDVGLAEESRGVDDADGCRTF